MDTGRIRIASFFSVAVSWLPWILGEFRRDYPNVEKRTVRYSELDCNGHLSNTKYLNWMDDLLPSAFHRDNCLSRLHICYQNEALEGQEIALNWALEGNLLSLEGRRDQAPHRVFALRAQYRRL